jgi:hypothetical protein
MDSGAREIYIRPYPGPGGRVTVSVNGGVEPRWALNGEVFYKNAAGDRMFSVSTSTTPTLTVGKPSPGFPPPSEQPAPQLRPLFAVVRAYGTRCHRISLRLASDATKKGLSF